MWKQAAAPQPLGQASAEYPRGTAGTRAALTVSLVSAKLWSAEEPNLYVLTLELYCGEELLGAESTRVGVRTVKACRAHDARRSLNKENATQSWLD